MPELTYTASSLEEIADVLDHRAVYAGELAAMATTKHQEHYHLGERDAYNHASRILRNTTLEPQS